MSDSPIVARIPEKYAGHRMDTTMVAMFPDYSRSRLQQWIKSGNLLVDGRVVRAKDKVLGDELVELKAELLVNESCPEPQDIPLNIVFEDDDLIVINKKAGMVVHPAAGNYDKTLLNALLYHDEQLQTLPRAGIIHRLDKNTTGLLVVAKNIITHKRLVDKLQAREIDREYQAVVHGVMIAGGVVEQPIGRHPKDRLRMSIREDGKEARTHYKVLRKFREFTLIYVKLETGRTHQIRVHMQYIKHSLVGDPVYAGRKRIPSDASENFKEIIQLFDRQALHAYKLGLHHPVSGELMNWEVSLPNDMEKLINAMQLDTDLHANR